MEKSIILAAVAFALAITPASADLVTFKDAAGKVWTITKGGNGAGVSALHISPDAEMACPGRRIMLEPSKLGPAQTKEQKFRGDKRWHIVCDRSPVAAAATR